MKIWGKRWSVAYGNHWQLERECHDDNTQSWLKIFRDDEPNVNFIASKKRPPEKS